MPAIFGSKYKTPRIEAISEIIAKEDYDIFLLQELWMESDHQVIASKVPKNYFITGFRQLSEELCDGHWSPGFCSGLAIGMNAKICFTIVTIRHIHHCIQMFGGKIVVKLNAICLGILTTKQIHF